MECTQNDGGNKYRITFQKIKMRKIINNYKLISKKMVYPICRENYWVFRKMFQTKVVRISKTYKTKPAQSKSVIYSPVIFKQRKSFFSIAKQIQDCTK